MKIIKEVTQSEVISHWEKVEKCTIYARADIVFPFLAYNNLVWNTAQIEQGDLNKIFIISSDDWKTDGVCVPDFKLTTAIVNYNNSLKSSGKFLDIKNKEKIFTSGNNFLDTKMILVANNPIGPYTIIEGNKRSIALGSLNKLVGINIFIGISEAIRGYIWSRYCY